MSKSTLQQWVDSLRKKNMPVLGSVIAELNSVTGSDASNANHLAEVILRDPNLTSHVLRVANSVHYNYSKQKINTISRAIVLIGLKGMRALCISLLILDRFLSEKPKERVLALIARGFHAATQAQNLLASTDPADQEEAFIAGLLYNLGEMAFWMSNDSVKYSDELTSTNLKERKKAIEKTIGGSFKALTRELGKHWQLGDTLQEALYPGEIQSDKVRSVIMGERISRAALFGWDSPQVKKVLGEVATYKGIDLEAALVEIKRGADQAAKVAMSYGATDACPFIPSSLKASHIRDVPQKLKIMKPNTKVQLNILRELSAAATEKTEVNTLFQMVLEGMHRGVGLERVAIGFVKGHKLKAKYVIGEGTDHWRSSFLFDVSPYTDNIFTTAIEQDSTLWLDDSATKQKSELYSDDIIRVIGRMPCLVFVVKVGQRPSAVFYADRFTFGGKINLEQCESFKHFGAQAQLSLNALAKSR